jgi:Flp pilus assembly protein CpaB
MNYSVRNIVIAVGLAACAVVAVLIYTSNFQSRVNAQQEQVKVLVAASDIPAGTTVQQIIDGHLLVPTDIVRRDQVPGALTTLAGAPPNFVATQTIYSHSQAPAAVFQPSVTSAVPVQIQKTERAVSIPVDTDAGLIGTLKAGDHVDVIDAVTVTSSKTGLSTSVTEKLLSNVTVLKAPDASAAGGTGHVQLKVTDVEATKLVWAREFAKAVYLIIRPQNGARDSAGSVQTTASVLLDPLNSNGQKAILRKQVLKAS